MGGTDSQEEPPSRPGNMTPLPLRYDGGADARATSPVQLAMKPCVRDGIRQGWWDRIRQNRRHRKHSELPIGIAEMPEKAPSKVTWRKGALKSLRLGPGARPKGL